MGDILVFLTGQDDIDTAVQLLTEEAQNIGKRSSGISDLVFIYHRFTDENPFISVKCCRFDMFCCILCCVPLICCTLFNKKKRRKKEKKICCIPSFSFLNSLCGQIYLQD